MIELSSIFLYYQCLAFLMWGWATVARGKLAAHVMRSCLVFYQFGLIHFKTIHAWIG